MQCSHLILYFLVIQFLSVGKDIREKFSGAVEAFSRRNPAGSSPHVDHVKQRSFEDVPVQKDMVNIVYPTPIIY